MKKPSQNSSSFFDKGRGGCGLPVVGQAGMLVLYGLV